MRGREGERERERGRERERETCSYLYGTPGLTPLTGKFYM